MFFKVFIDFFTMFFRDVFTKFFEDVFMDVLSEVFTDDFTVFFFPEVFATVFTVCLRILKSWFSHSHIVFPYAQGISSYPVQHDFPNNEASMPVTADSKQCDKS